VVILALLMVPVFFVSVMRFFGRDDEAKAESAAVAEPYGPPAQTIQ
jgi:ABC-type cobalt transport system substrate-binding protein